MSVRVEHGDCLAEMRRHVMLGTTVDAVVTDPPYHLTSIVKRFGGKNAAPAQFGKDGAYARASAGFMNKTWDGGDIALRPETWALAFELMKPGAHLAAFGGTRTFHRMAVAIEDAGFEIRDTLSWLYGSGFPKSHNAGNGWGTALKPAWEPIVLARKPLGIPATNVLIVVECELRRRGVTGEIRWVNEPVSGAAKPRTTTSSGSTRPSAPSGTSAKTAAGSATPSFEPQTPSGSETAGTNGRPEIQDASGASAAPRTGDFENKSSQHMAERAPAAESENRRSSPSITSTAAEQPTARPSTVRSTPSFAGPASPPAIECFAGIATGLTGSQAHVRIWRLADGSFAWPADLPRIVPARPLTVAANVLEHGTGAINIDGCRVGNEAVVSSVRGGKGFGANFRDDNWQPPVAGRDTVSAGRWPANVLHDGSEEVLQCFPQSAGQQGDVRGTEKSEPLGANTYGRMAGRVPAAARGDSGSAARFFFSAKADADDRIGSKHPTVKPVALMRWLVRLVTPKGGLVLDPFAGTGTTGVACIREGMDAILIEREAEYHADIQRRLAMLSGLDTPLLAGAAE